MNNEGPYRIDAIRSGILTGHSATVDNSNLIVENIMMNDVRNGSEYRCVILPAEGLVTFADIIAESDPTILYVAGEYHIILYVNGFQLTYSIIIAQVMVLYFCRNFLFVTLKKEMHLQ